MLTQKIGCPSCGVNLRVAGPRPAGKRIRCPRCGETFPVAAQSRPEARPAEEEENPFELVEERPEPPRRRLKKKAKGNSGLMVGAILAGVTLLVGGAVAVGVMYWPKGGTTTPVASNAPGGGSAAASGGSDGLSVGKRVFDANCVRCHSVGGTAGAGRGRNRGPDLSSVGRDPTHTVDWLIAFIREPQSQKPDSRMGGFEGRLNDGELRAVAEYLASLK